MQRIIFILFILAFLDIPTLVKGDEGKGGQAGAFLRIPVGARPAGMGNAFTAISDDANTLYFNPGGLYQVDRFKFGGMYSIMSMDRNHYQGSFIYSTPVIGSLGLMIHGFGISDIEGRDNIGMPTETFDDSENAFIFGYGRKILPFLGIGGNVKYITHLLMDNKATGIGYDLGIHSKIKSYAPYIEDICFGISFTNIGTSITWNTDSSNRETIPVTMRFGTGTYAKFKRIKALIALDGSHTSHESFVLHGGGEVWFLDILGIRVGLDDTDATFGFSIKYQKFQFDYAFCPDVLKEGETNKCGLQIDF